MNEQPSLTEVYETESLREYGLRANCFAQASIIGMINGPRSTDKKLIYDTIVTPISLNEVINEQIIFSCRDPKESFIARQVTESLDEAGYLVE